MSTQMDFIMQLYMMNLMQQQQQLLQQQQQQQSPTKAQDISTTSNTPQPKRTLKRKNSQATNCSSSRSCSPNSNVSFVQSNNLYPTAPLHGAGAIHPYYGMQQMLLNNIAAPTTLLTPTTPGGNNSSSSSDMLLTTHAVPTSAASAAAATCTVGSSNIADSLSHRFSLVNNFLQSSTVTSTPTEKSPAPLNMEQDVSEVVADDHHGAAVGRVLGYTNIKEEMVEHIDNVEAVDYEQHLSSVHSSSGETSSKLFMYSSGMQALESTDSLESSHMPYTPLKQPADSSFSGCDTQLPLALCYKDSSATHISSTNNSDSEQAHVSPPSQFNAMLTPPASSEQLLGFETKHATTAVAANTAASAQLTTASSLDAFLQNEENLKHLKKYSSYLECENVLCRQENLREHFHCFDAPCQGKILSKKDDIIRHLKWHKKRKESLLLGFARFSAADDCAPSYGAGCAYNWKQTHYHCVYEDCPKVYVSTSDVQMHANFHRKNSEIVQEGFRRFRAHENCKIDDCPFYGKKTSHYHCCREGCQHTFKNKADMDKHKSYHLKDFQLTQDGFKKILKTEVCPFEECKFSSVCNHIHCVRDNCNYILHSSSQMISHKRKHDRLDGEQAYQQFKKDSSEEESPPQPAALNNNSSTPLSSLSAEHFLARKRGRPPKKIQLPADVNNAKRLKLEMAHEHQPAAAPAAFPPFLPSFNPAANTQNHTNAAATADVNGAPNFQLTHLMALFQLQNPLFYQNMYPGGMAANMSNMANMLGAAAAAAQNPMFANSATYGANIKSEYQEKSQHKE